MLTRRVESAERLRWHTFYADRTRPCPFFGFEPDENLIEWVGGGRIQLGTALDVGCGNGRNSIYLASAGFRTQGVDLSEQAIAWARERAAANSAQVGFVSGSILDNAPAPQSLDLVYDSGCFHHMAPHQRDQYARLVAQALKPGGHFGLVCFAPEGGSGYTDEQVYQEGSLGGGLGYSGATLREFWGKHLKVVELRRMNEAALGSGTFGKNFLWAMLASGE
jgi:SAM-dependent methyltransferase